MDVDHAHRYIHAPKASRSLPPAITAEQALVDLPAINDGLNDALNSSHTYRDALVQEVASGRTEGIVTAAYLLSKQSINHALARGIGTDVRRAVYSEPSSMFQGSNAS